MQEDYDSRDFLITEGCDIVQKAEKELEIGSEEFSRACSNAKWMFDAANRQNEIEFKERELEQNLRIHKDNTRSNWVRNGIEATKVVLSGVAIGIGYRFNFKENGIEFGKAFTDVKNGVTRFLHKW